MTCSFACHSFDSFILICTLLLSAFSTRPHFLDFRFFKEVFKIGFKGSFQGVFKGVLREFYEFNSGFAVFIYYSRIQGFQVLFKYYSSIIQVLFKYYSSIIPLLSSMLRCNIDFAALILYILK